MSAQGEFNDAVTFALGSIKLGLLRHEARMTRLEDAFLKAHPMAVLPDIPLTEEELAFMEEHKDLIES